MPGTGTIRRMGRFVFALLPFVAGGVEHVHAQQPATMDTKSSLDVFQLFATTCGWCHSDGGRAPGKGPQLMNTQRSDDFIRTRIKLGKEGAMPAFGSTLSDADIDAIVRYIRALKPEQG
jgi:mono/diheme cytochrome c family protein